MAAGTDEVTTTSAPAARSAPSPSPAAGTTAPPAATPQPTRRVPWPGIVLAVASGLFLSVFDQTAVGVAYSAVQDEFGVDNVDIQWVTTAYRLGQAAAIPAALWLTKRFGPRRMFLVCMTWFAVASALCGLAPDLGPLLAFRVLQAVPGGLIAIVGVAILLLSLPRPQLPIAATLAVTLVISAPGFSPPIGGALTQHVDWRMTFLVAVPLALVGLVVGYLFVPDLSMGDPGRFDLAGYLAITVALMAVLLGVAQGTDWGWTSYRILGLFVLAANALIFFVIVELQVENPILDLRVLTYQPFVVALVIIDMLTMALASVLAFLPSFLQSVQGLTPTNAGLVFVPQGIAWCLSIPLSTFLALKLGIRWTTAIGLTITGLSTAALVQLNVDLPRAETATILVFRAIGLGLTLLPLLTGAISALPPQLAPPGIVLRTIVQRVFSAIGIVLFSTLVSIRNKEGMAARSALVDPADLPPQLAKIHATQPEALLPVYRQLQAEVSAQTYGGMFLLIGLVTLVGVVLCFVARWDAAPSDGRAAVGDGGGA